MIKISAGIAYEQNRPTGVASALNAQFVFFGVRNALYKNKFSDKSCYQSQYGTFVAKFFFDRPTSLASVLIAQLFFFLAKRALKMR